MIDKIRLGFGLLDYPFENGREFFKWAEFLEEHQIDSLWQSDRLVSTDPYLESLTALATLAGCTEKLKFGMNAIVAPLRDPLVLAKQCATIDYLSGGRLLPMFGVGYPHAVEWGTTGRSSDHGGSKLMRCLSFLLNFGRRIKLVLGEFFQYKDACIEPKPVQQPLPLWIGGNSKAAIKRIARLGSLIGGAASPLEVKTVIDGIKEESKKIGRSIDSDHYGASLAF